MKLEGPHELVLALRRIGRLLDSEELNDKLEMKMLREGVEAYEQARLPILDRRSDGDLFTKSLKDWTEEAE